MDWKYNPGDLVTWQGTHARHETTGYVIDCLPATDELSDPRIPLGRHYANQTASILSDLGFDQHWTFFEQKLKKIPASSNRDRYLVWVPSRSGKTGKFQSPIKQTVDGRSAPRYI